jgi:hypothetical protein
MPCRRPAVTADADLVELSRPFPTDLVERKDGQGQLGPRRRPPQGRRSDALKRCAMRLGLGLRLWAQEHYFLDQQLKAQHREGSRPAASRSATSRSAATGGTTCRLDRRQAFR